LKQYIGKRLISQQTYPLTLLNGKCNFNMGPAINSYLTKAGYFGGVCTVPDMEFLNNIGAKWNRYTGRGRGGDWIGIEYEKDKYNVSGFLNDVKAHKEGNSDFVLLMCTYDQPKWRNYRYPDFATGYGRLMESIAKENAIDEYELGNEDNGSHTKTYTEVGRNGAAGIRKYDSSALISPAATGGIDLYYFNEQKEKGLLDRMDLLIVHPYTGNNNPEDFKLVENSESMQDIIDEVGGYKSLWSTEFGYNDGTEGPSVLPDKIRGRFYTRSSMLQILAGYDRVGPFTWFNYWGLFLNYNGTLRGVAYQTMCKQLEGYRYAGTLSAGPKLWVLIFEKFGKNPVAVCWTNEGEADYNFGSAVTYTDSYNNKINKFRNFSEDLTYVRKLSDSTLINAWNNSINKELAKVKNYSGVSLTAETDTDTMWTELCNFGKQMKSFSPCIVSIDKPNEAKISASSFRLLKALLFKCRYDKCPKELENYNIGDFEKECKDFLENARLGDKTYAKTRYMINLFINTDLEKQAAIETNNSDFAQKLENCKKIIAFFTREYLMNDSDARQDQVWAYIYNLKGEDLNEKITLVPDVPIRVKIRVNNYSLNEQDANITLRLPEGWTYEPKVQTVHLTPGKDENTYFDIIASSDENSKDIYIITETALGDNPIKGYAKFTEVELLSEISVTQIPSHGVHPESPMEFLVTNSGNETKSGTIKLYSENKLVGSGTFENIAPKESKIAFANFTDIPTDLNNMKAVVSGDNLKTSHLDFKTEYCYAPKAENLDINQPAEILGKYPLFIDREEYDWGSFLGSWSPNDCSANCYFAWNENYLWFRGLVTDNVFCQISQDGHDMYEWDSMQINIVSPKNEIIQFGIAHVGDEDMVYMYRPRTEKMKDIPCKVKIGSNTHDYIMA
ncbi:MAG: hypothetical protein KBT47_06105, partial [Armatimonadetes bacterium]|nr:hypothetical protein [Candidatus Hippobium faecium]